MRAVRQGFEWAFRWQAVDVDGRRLGTVITSLAAVRRTIRRPTAFNVAVPVTGGRHFDRRGATRHGVLIRAVLSVWLRRDAP